VALWRTAVERKIEGTFAGMTVVTIVEIPIEYVVPFGAIKQWLQVSCHKKKRGCVCEGPSHVTKQIKEGPVRYVCLLAVCGVV